jgi:hypothetical protein
MIAARSADLTSRWIPPGSGSFAVTAEGYSATSPLYFDVPSLEPGDYRMRLDATHSNHDIGDLQRRTATFYVFLRVLPPESERGATNRASSLFRFASLPAGHQFAYHAAKSDGLTPSGNPLDATTSECRPETLACYACVLTIIRSAWCACALSALSSRTATATQEPKLSRAGGTRTRDLLTPSQAR